MCVCVCVCFQNKLRQLEEQKESLGGSKAELRTEVESLKKDIEVAKKMVKQLEHQNKAKDTK